VGRFPNDLGIPSDQKVKVRGMYEQTKWHPTVIKKFGSNIGKSFASQPKAETQWQLDRREKCQ
jgi:hypothetical protein